MSFKLTDNTIQPATLREQLLSTSAGAFCNYEGWVRNHNEGKAVAELHYSSYPQLAPVIAEAIIAEAKDKFQLEAAVIVHRTGPLAVGDIAVWVGATAHHRGDTFLGCRYIIDNVKHRLPIWKKEIYTDGSEAWIENNHCGCADPANVAGASSSMADAVREQDAPTTINVAGASSSRAGTPGSRMLPLLKKNANQSDLHFQRS
jgi:molybdopterin synthase catalytic subunit